MGPVPGRHLTGPEKSAAVVGARGVFPATAVMKDNAPGADRLRAPASVRTCAVPSSHRPSGDAVLLPLPGCHI